MAGCRCVYNFCAIVLVQLSPLLVGFMHYLCTTLCFVFRVVFYEAMFVVCFCVCDGHTLCVCVI